MRSTEGTGRAAYEKYGLKKFPAAGKTGTAYDFTDALFAGYDSALTCVVWAGFDKPQKIYRGAFGSVLALPVWVDVMNASAARRVPQEFPVPAGLHRVEICDKSGLLATDKCYENVPSASGTVRRRTSYVELATNEQMPADRCDVHSDSVRTQLVKKFENSQWPRAALAINTAQVAPVVAQGRPCSRETILTTRSVRLSNPRPWPTSRRLLSSIRKSRSCAPSRWSPASENQVEVRRAATGADRLTKSGNETLLQSEPPPAPLDFSEDH